MVASPVNLSPGTYHRSCLENTGLPALRYTSRDKACWPMQLNVLGQRKSLPPLAKFTSGCGLSLTCVGCRGPGRDVGGRQRVLDGIKKQRFLETDEWCYDKEEGGGPSH